MVSKEKIIQLASRFQGSDIEKSFPMDYCIPVYHAVSDEYIPHLKHIIRYKSEKEFEHDLDELSRSFQFITWDEFKDFRNGTFRPKKKIALLTFDDGLSEFYHNAVPILLKKGIYAINFINPSFVNNDQLMFRNKASLILDALLKSKKGHPEIDSILAASNISGKNLKQKMLNITFENRNLLDKIAQLAGIDVDSYTQSQKPYMNLEQLKSLTQKGFGISNHGWNHPLYNGLTLNAQLENTEKGAEFLADLGFIADSFAFPFTDFGVKKSFFDEIFSRNEMFCTFGCAGIKRDSIARNYQRIPMENGKPAAQTIKEEIAYFNIKKLFNRNEIHRK